MSVLVFVCALVGMLATGGALGVGYGFGAHFTAARVVVLLCSGAGLGGLFATARVLFSAAESWEETRRAIAAFAVLLAILAGACAAVLS